ncbi:hypothetical protein M6D81_25470 [Paenibacillus sp. J5C_2022]|uniref:hypothetical protein n=1 Tax=Paenibacillus sp. J5C2022 TaxID=2977129 RepID=UPI0021D3D9A5|nr:hypothetical protein [Paenibacillus sp. J5C2022]MCU6712052.1 hypothetical protein [Paenibacillus sp. J5C2022]
MSTSTFQFDPIVPFFFAKEKRRDMLQALRRMKYEAGIRRFVLVFPYWYGEAKELHALEAYENFGDMLREIRETLAADDIEVGWWCAPSLRVGPQKVVESESPYYFQKVVGIDGALSRKANCPLDSNFQTQYCDYLQAVVSRGRPPVIFFEDDYQMSNHDVVGFGCFCPKHLQRFEAKTGRKMTREQLEELFRQGGDLAVQYRTLWAELMKDSLVELSERLRAAVDTIAPDTRMALCQPGVSDFDGMMTGPVARALAGSTRPLIRLFGTEYNSDAAQNLPRITFHMLYSKQVLDRDIELIHESDTFPHTRFFFSAVKLRALIAISMLYGLDGSLSYITQYTDGPLEEPAYIAMIRDSRPFFTELRRATQHYQFVGPRILYRPQSHVFRPIEGVRAPVVNAPAWVAALGSMGIPYTPGTGEGPVMACGEDVLDMSEQEITRLLQGGVFLDGAAACHLSQAGYSDLLGVEMAGFEENERASIAHEKLTERNLWNDHTAGTAMYHTNLTGNTAYSQGLYKLIPGHDSIVLSEFVNDYEKPVSASAVMYTNRLGGRVAIIAFNLQLQWFAAVHNYKRKQQFRGIIEWLGGRSLPIFAEKDPNLFIIAKEENAAGNKLAAIINMGMDTASRPSFVVDSTWRKRRAAYLNDHGDWTSLPEPYWHPLDNDKFRWVCPIACSTLRPLVIKFSDE